jgi:hypothetical protein
MHGPRPSESWDRVFESRPGTDFYAFFSLKTSSKQLRNATKSGRVYPSPVRLTASWKQFHWSFCWLESEDDQFLVFSRMSRSGVGNDIYSRVKSGYFEVTAVQIAK